MNAFTGQMQKSETAYNLPIEGRKNGKVTFPGELVAAT
jgi:hypothetical protein